MTGHTLHLQNKDSILTALRYWIVELGEVDATFRKSDVSALKSFITQTTDAIRRPYAMTESTYPRRTGFGASVNDDQFLADPTGNRRFWTVPVTAFDLDHKVDMQQLWAEVLTLYQGGERWFLDRDEVHELNEHNESFRVTDPVEERIASGWAWPSLAEREGCVWEWVTATEALIRLGYKEPKRGDAIAAGRVIRRMNGGQYRKSNGKMLVAIPCVSNEFLG
jgi:putative DNA primase/helicase